MDQDRIWEYYQNDRRQSFEGAIARLSYMADLTRRGERVLNIGVGDGYLERILAEKGRIVSVLDPSRRSIDNIRDALHLGNRARVGYCQDIPFDDDSFDVVVMSEVLEHLSDEVLEKTLLEVRRILRPGGRFIGTVPARENLLEQMVICPDCGKRFHRWGHVQSFDANRLKGILARHFRVRRVMERLFVPWSSINWKGKLVAIFKVLASRLGIHGSGENLIFVAEKVHNQEISHARH